MNKAVGAIIVSGLYLTAAIVAYVNDFYSVLSILSLPWSYPIMLFSGLILEMDAKGNEQMDVAKLVGAILNVLLFLFWRVGGSSNISDQHSQKMDQ
jgi:hypothetical protein